MKTDEYLKRTGAQPAAAPSEELDAELDDFEGSEFDQEYECYMTEQAEPDDLQYLLEIDEELRGNPARQETVGRAIRNKACSLVSDSKQLIAYGIFDYTGKDKQGCVKHVFVAPDYRLQGVGAEMLMTFESTCDTPKIYASIPVTNLAAQEMVKSVGYRPVRSAQTVPGEILFMKKIWEAEAPMPLETVQ